MACLTSILKQFLIAFQSQMQTPPKTPFCIVIQYNKFLASFRNLVIKLNDMTTSNIVNPPVSCIVSDNLMTLTITAAEEFRLPIVLFFTLPASACNLMGSKHYSALVER
ncbi:unnamed protein product [Malus baccata var. baccata]